jgi:transcriptional regulator with XRE-family HTH domain
MGRKLNQIIEALPRTRREAIHKNAARIAEAMVQASLQELRQAADKTQAEVAAKMGLAQNAVSQMESRSDLRLSTLNRYVEAMGGQVNVVIVLRDGQRFQLRRNGKVRAIAANAGEVKESAVAAKAASHRGQPARRSK